MSFNKNTKERSKKFLTSRERALELANEANSRVENELGVTAVEAVANEGEHYSQIEGSPTSGDPVMVEGTVPNGKIQVQVTERFNPKAERLAQDQADRRNPFL